MGFGSVVGDAGDSDWRVSCGMRAGSCSAEWRWRARCLEIQELAGVSLHSPWVLWTAPFWLGWYLVVQAKASRPLMPITAQDLGYSVS